MMRLSQVRALGVAAAVVTCSALRTQQAHAYSDPSRFADPVIKPAGSEIPSGGGGGRYFTGSIADGYTCKVCHDEGEQTRVRIGGLPLEGYSPGGVYPISVEWPSSVQHVAVAAEITDVNGAPLGNLVVPDAAVLSDEELCLPVGFGIPATQVIDVPADGVVAARKVAFVVDCGAKRARLEWHAPLEDRGPGWFVGSLVRSDGEANNTGDSVTDFARTFGSPSRSDVVASDIGASCAVRGAGQAKRGANAAWLGLLAAVLWLRRKRS